MKWKIKVMFQTTNQMNIIFLLLLVYSLWQPLLTITINQPFILNCSFFPFLCREIVAQWEAPGSSIGVFEMTGTYIWSISQLLSTLQIPLESRSSNGLHIFDFLFFYVRTWSVRSWFHTFDHVGSSPIKPQSCIMIVYNNDRNWVDSAVSLWFNGKLWWLLVYDGLFWGKSPFLDGFWRLFNGVREETVIYITSSFQSTWPNAKTISYVQ